MPGTGQPRRRARRLVPGIALCVAAALAGCRGGDPPAPAPPDLSGSPAPASPAPPGTAAEFWTRLRAAAAVLQAPPSPGSAAGERAWDAACLDLQALAAAVRADRDAYQVETGARLGIVQVAGQCPQRDAATRRAVAATIPGLLENDPFAAP